MPKPFRAKHGKREIGNYLCRVRGRRINLETKLPKLARERARLAALGLWPPETAAADAVAGVLDGLPVPIAATSVPPRSDGAPSAEASTTPPAENAPSPTDAANQAAAELTGATVPDSGSLDPAELDREFNRELRAALGFGGDEPADDVAALLAGATREIVAAIGPRLEPPRYLPASSAAPAPKLLKLESISLKYLALKHGSRLPEISPAWALVVLATIDLLIVWRSLEPGLPPPPEPGGGGNVA